MVFNSPSTSLKKVICHFWSDIAYGHGNYRRIMVRDIEMIEKGNWFWVFLGFASTFFCCCYLKALLPYSYLCLFANFLWLHSKAAVHPQSLMNREFLKANSWTSDMICLLEELPASPFAEIHNVSIGCRQVAYLFLNDLLLYPNDNTLFFFHLFLLPMTIL